MKILAINEFGEPYKWITPEEAILCHARNLVKYDFGEAVVTFRGGINRDTGEQSILSSAPILAIEGAFFKSARVVPPISNGILFQRDKFRCAYCGKKFSKEKLTRDHIIPVSKGGKDNWLNITTACHRHNVAKGSKLLAQLGWKLFHEPYVPTMVEYLILRGPEIILPIQVDYLLQFVKPGSEVETHLLERKHSELNS